MRSNGDKGKPRAIWGRKVVRPLKADRQIAELRPDPGNVPGFFFGKKQSAWHFQAENAKSKIVYSINRETIKDAKITKSLY